MSETILLVDYENVKDTGLRQLPSHDRIQLFVGKGQKPKIDFVKDALDRGTRLDMIQVAEQGRNNLDFYIAFYLGKALQEEANARFIVFSNDQDLDPLLAHLVKRGISCSRVGTMKAARTTAAPRPMQSIARALPAPQPRAVTTPAKPAPAPVRTAAARPAAARPVAARPAAPKPVERKLPPKPDYDLEDAMIFLKNAGKRQPKGRKALVNSLADHLQLKGPDVERIIAALVQSGFLAIAKERVTYR